MEIIIVILVVVGVLVFLVNRKSKPASNYVPPPVEQPPVQQPPVQQPPVQPPIVFPDEPRFPNGPVSPESPSVRQDEV